MRQANPGPSHGEGVQQILRIFLSAPNTREGARYLTREKKMTSSEKASSFAIYDALVGLEKKNIHVLVVKLLDLHR